MAATATTALTLNFGQWTQVGALNDEPIITPKARDWKLLIRYQASNPGVGVVDGHEYCSAMCGPNVNCLKSATFNVWARPMYPEVNMPTTITRI